MWDSIPGVPNAPLLLPIASPKALRVPLLPARDLVLYVYLYTTPYRIRLGNKLRRGRFSWDRSCAEDVFLSAVAVATKRRAPLPAHTVPGRGDVRQEGGLWGCGHFFFFFLNFYLFMIVTQRERERGRDTGRGRSRLHTLGARCGIRSRASLTHPSYSPLLPQGLACSSASRTRPRALRLSLDDTLPYLPRE